MLRWTMLLLAGAFVAATARKHADNAVPAKSRAYRAARQLPPGLPRADYNYRTTVAPATPYRDPVVIETDESLLITPAYGPGGYLANLPGTPILPGSSTIPGYYGRPLPMIIRARITAAPMKAITGACPTPAASTATASRVARAELELFRDSAHAAVATTTRPLHDRNRQHHDCDRLMRQREIDRHLVEQREDAEHRLQQYSRGERPRAGDHHRAARARTASIACHSATASSRYAVMRCSNCTVSTLSNRLRHHGCSKNSRSADGINAPSMSGQVL